MKQTVIAELEKKVELSDAYKKAIMICETSESAATAFNRLVKEIQKEAEDACRKGFDVEACNWKKEATAAYEDAQMLIFNNQW